MKRMMGPGGFRGLRGLGGLGGRVGLSLASLCLGACLLGGTGSDHENGVAANNVDEFKIKGVTARVTDGEGSPIAGVSLYLYDPAYRPDLGQARNSQLTDTAPLPVTDSLGYAALDLSAPGKFVVEGVYAGKTLFFDTLAAPVLRKATLFTFRSRAPSFFRGKVALVSGMRIDSGSVFIRGTSRTAKLDASGNYDLGALPSDAGRMGLGVRYVSSPTSVQESKQISLGDTGLPGPAPGIPPPYICKDVSAKESKISILTSPASAVGADTGVQAMEKVDSTQLDRALNACDTLLRGGVINVVSQDSLTKGNQNRDSTAVPVLVLTGETSVPSFNGTRLVPARVIPYAGCVPAAGRETTSYAVKVQATAVQNDILIGDVAAACLDK
jgi:hypothetical protein